MELTFINKVARAADVYSFIFQPSESISWKAGQYMDFEITHTNPDDRGTHRWFTISSAPFEKNVMVTTRFTERSSTFKSALLKLKPGDRIMSGLPRGDFIIGSDQQHYILIAGGIGITPYRSMLEQLKHEGKDLRIDLLYANQNEDLVFIKELGQLKEELDNFKIHKFIDRRISEQDLKIFTEQPDTVFYISGPRPMVEAYETMLQKMIDPERIKTDYFPGY